MRLFRHTFSTSAPSARLHLYRLGAVADAGRPLCRASTSSGHELVTDLPRNSGGENRYAQPVEMLLASLLGCKAATAHFVARHLWPRPHNRIQRIEFVDVLAARDERGALHLPVNEDAPVPSALLYAPWCCFFLVVTLFRMYVRAVVRLTPSSGAIGMKDVVALGSLVEKRCPVAAMLVQAGVQLDFRWMLTPLER